MRPEHDEGARPGAPPNNHHEANGTARITFASAAAFVRAIRDAEVTGWGAVVQMLAEDGIEVDERGRVTLLWPAVRS